MDPTGLESPFGFSVNLDMSFWSQILNWPSDKMQLALFAIVGWAVLAIVFFWMGSELFLRFRQDIHTKDWKWLVLAVDVPAELVQTPKAVEQIFAHLHGAAIGPNVGEKYWQGKKQKWFSLEIISMGGYIQFLIYTESQFRDLVEAAVYAQYPQAEITEVEDYVKNIPDKYPSDEYDMLGVEFTLADNEAYPIRVYSEFEHTVTKDFQFNDPMAAILENFTRIAAGENFWMQIIVEPSNDSWKQKGIDLVKNIIETKKPAAKEGLGAKAAGLPVKAAGLITDIWNWNFEPAEGEKKVEPQIGKMSELPPGKKNTIQAIEEKISKVGFKTKVRALYAARKDIFNPSKCLNGLVGSLKQFQYIGRNSLVPYSYTEAYYAFKAYRTAFKKKKFTTAFKKRKMKMEGNPYVLNAEELATLWHFPLPLVKAPLVQKTAAKRGEPPMGLAIETDQPFEEPTTPGEEIKPTEPTEKEEEWG